MKFKTVDAASKQVSSRSRDLESASKNLSKVFNESQGQKGIDNITLNWAYRHLAKGFLLEGDEETAKSILNAMQETFQQKDIKPAVKKTIVQQSKEVLKLK
jgi:hypothetical protein